MKSKIFALALISTLAGGALAQTNAFEGFTAGINISSIGATTTLTDTDSKVDLGQQSAVPGIELSYNFAASSNFVLGISATYDFTKTKLGSISDQDGSSTFKGQNRMSINLKPGFLVTPNSMVYAVVGYNAMSTKIDANSATASPASESFSKTLNGIGYGAGVAVMIDKNIFVKAEVQQVNFNSWNPEGDIASIKPNLTVGTIGIGYKF